MKNNKLFALIVSVFLFFPPGFFAKERDTLKSALLLNEAIEQTNQQNYTKALEKIASSLKEDDTNAAAYFYRGYVYFQKKEYAKAIPDFLKANELNPSERATQFGWIASAYDGLGDTEKAEKYREMAKNPPQEEIVRLNPETIEGKDQTLGLETFNRIQKRIGNKSAKLSNELNNAAKKHAEYLNLNAEERIPTQLHYQERGKKGFIGVHPQDQAAAFGFQPKEGYMVGNTILGIRRNETNSTEHLLEKLATTLYHRNMVIAPNFDYVGFYVSKEEPSPMVVFFYSSQVAPAEDKLVFYPGENQTDIPTMMYPEYPFPIPGEIEIGFPITVQLFSRETKSLTIVKASLKNKEGQEIPFHKLDSANQGEPGQMMKTMKMTGLIARKPLDTDEEYKVYLKIADSSRKIVFEKEWKFRTSPQKFSLEDKSLNR